MSEAYDDMSHTMEEAAVYKERVMGTTPGNWQPPKTGLSLFYVKLKENFTHYMLMFLNLQVPLLFPSNSIELFLSLVCLKPIPGTQCIMAPLRPPAHIMVAEPPLRPPEHIMAAVMPQVPCTCVVSREVEQL